MITISDPKGPDAARALIDGMMTVAHLKGLHPDVVISANLSIIAAHARHIVSSRPAIAASLREILHCVETGNFPTQDQPIGLAAAGQHLH